MKKDIEKLYMMVYAMYLFEETKGLEKKFQVAMEKKNFNSTKIKIKNFQSYENSEKKFPILRKFKSKIFDPPKIFFGIFPRDPNARSETHPTGFH